MAPTKRTRPAFSPPRPKKSKSTTTTTTKPTATTSTATTTTNGARKSRKSDNTTNTKTTKPSDPKTSTTEPRRRSRLVSPTPSASDSQGDATQSSNEDKDKDGDEQIHSSSPSSEPHKPHSNPESPDQEPEPDYILAEVTHEPHLTSNPTIPLPLIHHILASHFSTPDKTKISTDAREVAGRYVDVFVREAIMRCAYEKNEMGDGSNKGDGWLEVEDLERIAVQLCLDF